jgi:hypothetical protein
MSRFLKIKATIIFIIMSFTFLFAQAPDTLWTKTYPGLLAFVGYSIRSTPNGGFVVGGMDTRSYGSAYVMRTDSDGDSLWAESELITYGSAYNCVAVSSDSIIAAVGWYHAIMGGQHSWGTAFSFNGTPLWIIPFYDDGGLDGNKATWVENTSDGGLIVADNPRNAITIDFDLRLSKINDLHGVSWSRRYGGFGNELSGAIRPDNEGGFIIAGSSSSFSSANFDGYLIRTDSIGDTLWTRTYGGPANDIFHEIVPASDSGYVAVGTTSSFGQGGSDIYIVKTNSAGDTLWTRTFGDTLNDEGHSIDKVPSGGYIVAGNVADRAYLIRLDENGDTLWTKAINPEIPNAVYSVISLPDSGFACTGSITISNRQQLWIVRLGHETVKVDDKAVPVPQNISLSQNYPNPFNSQTVISFDITGQAQKISLDIYNICGQKMATLYNGDTQKGRYQFIWDGLNETGQPFSSGIYFYRLYSASEQITKRMILLR